MQETPRVLGVVFCDRLAPDPDTGQVSLRGIFLQLEVFDFTDPAGFTLYALLEGGSGEGRLTVTVSEMHGRNRVLIYRHTRWITFVEEPSVRHFEHRLRGLRFRRPGPHLLELRYEGELVSERKLRVVQRSRL